MQAGAGAGRTRRRRLGGSGRLRRCSKRCRGAWLGVVVAVGSGCSGAKAGQGRRTTKATKGGVLCSGKAHSPRCVGRRLEAKECGSVAQGCGRGDSSWTAWSWARSTSMEAGKVWPFCEAENTAQGPIQDKDDDREGKGGGFGCREAHRRHAAGQGRDGGWRRGLRATLLGVEADAARGDGVEADAGRRRLRAVRKASGGEVARDRSKVKVADLSIAKRMRVERYHYHAMQVLTMRKELSSPSHLGKMLLTCATGEQVRLDWTVVRVWR